MLSKKLPFLFDQFQLASVSRIIIKCDTGLLQLLRVMVQVGTIRVRILEELKVEVVAKLFRSFMDGDISPNDPDIGSIEKCDLYTHGLALVNELAKHDINWMTLENNLMQYR